MRLICCDGTFLHPGTHMKHCRHWPLKPKQTLNTHPVTQSELQAAACLSLHNTFSDQYYNTVGSKCVLIPAEVKKKVSGNLQWRRKTTEAERFYRHRSVCNVLALTGPLSTTMTHKHVTVCTWIPVLPLNCSIPYAFPANGSLWVIKPLTAIKSIFRWD